nr:hypothetical protein CFP56_41382 [Quercus suber]
MPRDLATLAKEDSSSTTPELTKSPDTFDDQASSSFSSSAMDRSNQDPSRETRSDETKPEHDELHPYVQVLTESDVESCTQLEQEAFPPQERCTQEKRLTCASDAVPISRGGICVVRSSRIRKRRETTFVPSVHLLSALLSARSA